MHVIGNVSDQVQTSSINISLKLLPLGRMIPVLFLSIVKKTHQKTGS